MENAFVVNRIQSHGALRGNRTVAGKEGGKSQSKTAPLHHSDF